MFRTVSPIFLSGLLILGSSAPLLAETPQPKDADPGADLFQRGWSYDQGLGTSINIPEAIRLYEQSAALGNPLAKARLARIYSSGNGVLADQQKADQSSKGIFPEVLQRAEKNDPIAEVIVGTMYSDGLGVARDSAAALQWLRKAADQNLPLAQVNLGVMYQYGTGVPTDSAQAVAWFRRAADQNSAIGQAYLGDMYREGLGVWRDECEAARLYSLSAAQNYANAQTNLGYLYEQGCGVCWNPSQAVWLYYQAAQQNDDIAQLNLGRMYRDGCGVCRDLSARCTGISGLLLRATTTPSTPCAAWATRRDCKFAICNVRTVTAVYHQWAGAGRIANWRKARPRGHPPGRVDFRGSMGLPSKRTPLPLRFPGSSSPTRSWRSKRRTTTATRARTACICGRRR
jgi:TPR repeat protein